MDGNLLGLDTETMRCTGYRTVDMLVDGLSAVADGPAIRRASWQEMERRLAEPSPEAGRGFDEILDKLSRDVLPFASRTGHPRYFAFIPGSGTWWDLSREFYVVLEGTAKVRTADSHIADLGPGDFCGKLAAPDSGASFGYLRLASVIATSPVRLLVLPGARFNTLVRDAQGFGDRIRAAGPARLPGL